MAAFAELPRWPGAEHIPSPGAVASRGRIVDVTFSDLASTTNITNTTNPPTTVLHSHVFTVLNHRSTLVIHVNCGSQNNTSAALTRFGLLLDGTRLCGRGYKADLANCAGQVSLDFVVTDVAAGSHTLNVVCSVSAGTAAVPVDANRLGGVHVRVTEYALPSGSNDMQHFKDPLQSGGGRLIRTTSRQPNDPLLITASTAVPPTAIMFAFDFVTEQRSAVLIDVYCICYRPSSTGSGSCNYNLNMLIDGVAVMGRRGSVRTTNQARNLQLTHTTKTLPAGRHTLAVAWSGADSLTCNSNSITADVQRGPQPYGYNGDGPHAVIREYAL